MSDIKLISSFGDEIDIIDIDRQFQIRANITNNFTDEQIFAYSVFTTNGDSSKLYWITGLLGENQTFSPALSIIPEKYGTYQNTIMIFDKMDLEYRNLLSPTHNISFTTGLISTRTNENDFTFIPNTSNSPYNEFTVNSDLEYNYGETITITGNISEIPKIGIPSVTLFVDDMISSIEYVNVVPIKSDWTYEFIIDSTIFEIGDYELQINSGETNDRFVISIIQPISIQTDKSSFFLKENIFVNGTMFNVDVSKDMNISYKMLNLNNYSILKSGTNEILQNDGSFSFTINTINDTIFDNFSGDILLNIIIQNSTTSTNFYYSDKDDMTSETLHYKIENLTNTTNSLTNTTDSHKTILDYHDPMIYSNEDMGYYNKDMINILNQTNLEQTELINSQSIQIEQLIIDQKITTGFLSNLNVTLSVDVPPKLTEEALAEIQYELQRHQDEVDQLNANIQRDQIKLDEAIENGNENKILKYKKNIASFEVSILHSQAKINMSQLLLLVYPQ